MVYSPFDKLLFIVKIPDERTERKSQQLHQGKVIINEPRGIGVILPNLQVDFVLQQAIEHMDLTPDPTHYAGVKRSV